MKAKIHQRLEALAAYIGRTGPDKSRWAFLANDLEFLEGVLRELDALKIEREPENMIMLREHCRKLRNEREGQTTTQGN